MRKFYMSFNTFLTLTEGELANKASLILQAFIDNIDTAHYTKDDSKITFNVGKTIKVSRYSGLELVIRENSSENIRLGKSKSGNYAIVIDTSQLPSMSELEKFLESKRVMPETVNRIEEFIELKRGMGSDGDSSDVTKLTKYEQSKHFNSRELFEETYQKLVEALKSKITELEKILDNFKKEMEETNNPSRRVTLEMAMEKLKKEYIGSSEKDFINNAHKVLDEIAPQFRENLDKDNKKMLEDRLKQFFEEVS